MIGAVIGDIVGSRFEWHNIKKKAFRFFDPHCFFTDDTLMTLAIAKACYENQYHIDALGKECIKWMQEIGRPYPQCGYGSRFKDWIYADNPQPYHSFGNGAAMRVSAVAYVARTLDECVRMSEAVTSVSHDHPQGIKGAEAIAVAVFMAHHGASKDEIKAKMREYYNLDFTLDAIRPFYSFNETCMGTVPPAIVAFLESTDFEDAIRNAISIGGDSDTLAACTGAIAEAFYGVPDHLREYVIGRLPQELIDIIVEFEDVFPPRSYNYEN